MAEQYANAVQTTLNGAILVGATSMTLASATGVPTTGTFRALISAEGANTNEIVTVTGAAGPTYTIARATEAYAGVQSASAHGNGATVTVVLTDAGLRAVPVPLSVVLAAGNDAGAQSVINAGGVQGHTALVSKPAVGFGDYQDGDAAIAAGGDGTFSGAAIVALPGAGAHGAVLILAKNLTGNAGQVLTAQGDTTALWQTLPNSWARW